MLLSESRNEDLRGAIPRCTRRTVRSTSVRVLQEPGPATIRRGPSVVSTATLSSGSSSRPDSGSGVSI